MEFVFLAWFVIFPILSGIVAKNKGRSVWGWVVLGVLFGIFSFLVLLFLPSSQPLVATKACPHCAEQIRRVATVCRFCGNDVDVRRASHGTDAYRAHASKE